MRLSGCRILIVEDDFFIGEQIAAVLADAGAQTVGPFPTMIEALERLSQLNVVHGAVLDVGLQAEQSFPLADALRTTGIPFLFLTGMKKSHMPDRFAFVPHMEKPFVDAALVQALVDCGVAAERDSGFLDRKAA